MAEGEESWRDGGRVVVVEKIGESLSYNTFTLMGEELETYKPFGLYAATTKQ